MMPDEAEVQGLLALMLLHRVPPRRAAAATASSCCSPIRIGRCWDTARIAAGLAALERARALRGCRRVGGPGGPGGPYTIQAEIAALHSAPCDATGSRSRLATTSSRR